MILLTNFDNIYCYYTLYCYIFDKHTIMSLLYNYIFNIEAVYNCHLIDIRYTKWFL